VSDASKNHGAEELPSRLVFSLLRGAVRIAARVGMPLGRVTSLLRTAYFLELRNRHPRDLVKVSDLLGVSLRTAGTLSREVKKDFFAPESRVGPLRMVTEALAERSLTSAELADRVSLDAPELERALRHLLELGFVTEEEGRWVALDELRVFVNDDRVRRIDGLNHQLDVATDAVWARLLDDSASAGGRTWAFLARPEDVEAQQDTWFSYLRSRAVELEKAAKEQGGGQLFGLTVAFGRKREE